jgi:hypothetical protein
MTVENQIPSQSFTANGETVTFFLTFYLEGKDNIEVYINGELISMDYYNYDNLLNAIVFHVAPQKDTEVVLKRNTSLDRSIQYTTYNNTFRPEVLNEDIDRIIRILQEQGYTDSIVINQLAQEIYERTQQNIELKNQVENHTLDLNTIQNIQQEEINKRITGDKQVALNSREYTDFMLTMNNTNPSIFSGITDNIVITATGDSQRQVNENQIDINNQQLTFNTETNHKIETIEETFIRPEAYGAKANDPTFDNSVALNSAFATGKDIYSTPDKTYYVTKNLRTKGQRLIGGWKIHSKKNTSRAGIWEQTVTTVDEPEVNTDVIRMMYVATAYDLSEFLYIKSLGYNVLQHYSGMQIQGWDNDGNVQNMLDNAKSAGLKVIVGTQNDPGAIANVASWVASIDSHSAIIGYSVFDEPIHNGISVAEQNAKINLLRGITSKLLTTVEFTLDPLTKRLSDNYDIIFLDIYNDTNSNLSDDDATQEDLYKMRATFGLYNKQYQARIIPVVMGFKYVNGAPISRIVKTAKIFAKANGGNLGIFVWDGDAEPSIETSVRNSPQLETMSKDISAYRNLKPQIPEVLLWGYNTGTTQTNYGLQDLFRHQLHKDPNSIDIFEGINAYPTQVNGGSTDSDRICSSMTIGTALSALWFKGNYGAYVSNVVMRKYNNLIVHAGTVQTGNAPLITVRGTSTGGYGLGESLATIPIGGSVYNVKFINSASADFFCIKYDSATKTDYYRSYVRGLYVTSDW